jgi:hypothetical protein
MLLIVLLAGCVTTRDDWFRERNAALCDLYVGCFDRYADDQACDDVVGAYVDPTCDGFSVASAQSCVSALRAQADDCPTTDIDAWEIPAACADVCEAPGE